MIDILGVIDTLDFLFYIFIFLTGLALGSFINSWIWRNHDNTSITSGRSICVHCHRQLKWYENVPLFSFIFLGGRCRTCQKAIPLHYAAVELGTAVALVLVFNYHVNNLGQINLFSEWHILRDVFFLTILVVTFMYDYLYEEVLINIIILGILIGFSINFFPLHYSGWSLLIGLAAGAGFFLLQYLISHGRWIGGGDVWIGAMMGVWLGWPQALLAIFLAYVVGAIVSVFFLISKKKTLRSAVPLGVFLALATFFTLRYGEGMIGWYIQLLR